MPKLKTLFLLFSLISSTSFAQNTLKIISWNVLNLGYYTSNQKIEFIAEKIRDADLIVLQEVKSNSYGKADFEKLFAKLNQKENVWLYTLSGATSGPGNEQYAYIWRKNKLILVGKAWLEQSIESTIDREPYMARFKFKNSTFTLGNFHAVPKKKMPWIEVKLLPKIHFNYLNDNIILCGDFNLTYKDKAYNELYQNGYEAALKNQKTSIKAEEKDGERLANELDNFYYEKKQFNISSSGAIDFTKEFSSLKEAREVSDHLPIYLVLKF